MVKAPLVDEAFMAHSVPQMNLFEYKHKGHKIKAKFTRTQNEEVQTVPLDSNFRPLDELLPKTGGILSRIS